MYKNANPLFLICETQLHAGSGDDLGIVDLPIQRERHTSFPKIEASSFKGAVREAFENHFLNKAEKQNLNDNIKKVNQVFGFDDSALKHFSKDDMKGLFPEKERDFAGCMGFSDARLLLFPVKSMKGVFAWITCPRVLRQFEKDMKLTEGNEGFSIENIPNVQDGQTYLVTNTTNTKVGNDNVILEEYAFKIENPPLGNIGNKGFGEWLSEKLFADQELWKEKIKKDILILSDNDFKDFVNLSTEVITRTKISNKTGTVDKESGALFTEEYLPSESILYTLVLTSDEFKQNGMQENEVQEFFADTINAQEIIQVGGNATLGKGLIRTKFLNQTQNGTT